MSDIFISMLLGLVQGLTEFLPVSSSGHLAVFQRVLDVNFSEGKLYEMFLHLGTLVPLLVVFRKDIIKLFKPPFKTIGLILLASIPGVIVLFTVSDKIDEFLVG